MMATGLAEAKAAARRAAKQRRHRARADDGDRQREAAANARLQALLERHQGAALAGYMAIQSELSPLAAMTAWAQHSPACLPVVLGPGQPLEFRTWSPEAPMAAGAFGAMIPAKPTRCRPQILIVPLLAFDRTCARLGYGGGFYDRSLAALRAAGPVQAIGLAYGAQEAPDPVPREATDLALDAIVTEAEVIRPPVP